MILYQNKYKELKEFVDNSIDQFMSIIVTGDYGKGKSTIIQQVNEAVCRPLLLVCQYPGMNTAYEALYSSVCQKLEENSYDIKNINKEISHREYVKQLFITICRQTPNIVVVFQDMKDYEHILIELVRECIHYFKMHEITCCIIMEYSTDNLCADQEESLSICKDICMKHVKLDAATSTEFRDYFADLLKGKNQIDEQQMDGIITEAFFNPALIKKMVRYFIDVGIFYEQDGCWFSDEPDFHLTAKLFEEHISHRYEKLDDVLKATLNKASIIGYEFDVKLLSQPLGIIKAEEDLRRIERLSRLISHTENRYQFENNTVYNLINNKMNASEKKTLHHLLAEYLYEKIAQYQRTDPSKVLRILYLIKQHYLEAENIETALHVYGCYIQRAFQERNYDAALAGIKEYFEVSAGRYPYAEQQLLYLEINIHMILGDFVEAYKCLERINEQYLPIGSSYWIDYMKSYCLFNNGDTTRSQEIAEHLTDKLDSGCISDEFLMLKLDIFMAGMYHHFGNIRNANRRYEQGIAIAERKKSYSREYNYLLSISNMFLTNELAIPQILKSMDYFKRNHLMTSYAKGANNVAINYIYEGDFETAANHLEDSKQVFDIICSASIHYPLNNLATVYSHKGNYEKALELFTQAQSYQINSFSFLWISMNIANCVRKLGDLEKAETILLEVEDKIATLTESTLLLKRNFLISKGLLDWDNDDFSSACSCWEQALEIELHLLHNDTYPIYISKLLLSVCEKTNEPLPQIAVPYCNSFSDPFCQNLLDNHTHWGNFLFWEI